MTGVTVEKKLPLASALIDKSGQILRLGRTVGWGSYNFHQQLPPITETTLFLSLCVYDYPYVSFGRETEEKDPRGHPRVLIKKGQRERGALIKKGHRHRGGTLTLAVTLKC